MATSYPGAVDAFPNPAGSTDVDDASADLKHHNQHANVNDATEAIEAELGANPSGSFTTVKDRLDAQRRTIVNPAATSIVTVPGVAASDVGALQTIGFNFDYYFPVHCPDQLTFDRVLVEVSTASGSAGSVGRVGLYAAGADWQPTGTLIEDFGTFATDSTGVKTLTPSGGSRTLPGGRYLFAINVNAANTNFRAMRGGLTPALVAAALGSNLLVTALTVSRTHAAFPSTPLAWVSASVASTPYLYCVFLRVTAEG